MHKIKLSRSIKVDFWKKHHTHICVLISSNLLLVIKNQNCSAYPVLPIQNFASVLSKSNILQTWRRKGPKKGPHWKHCIFIDTKTCYVARRGNPPPVRGQKKPWGAKNFGPWRQPWDNKWGTPSPPQSHICTKSQETETPEAVESKSFICWFFTLFFYQKHWEIFVISIITLLHF